MQPRVFWTTPKKIIFTIILAAIAWALFGCASDKVAGHTKSDLEKHYAETNKQYFFDKLPKDTEFVIVSALYNDRGARLLGSTLCILNHCTITVDREMNPAPVTLELTVDHEMCHIATNGKNLDSHGEAFQSCMMDLANLGALKDIW